MNSIYPDYEKIPEKYKKIMEPTKPKPEMPILVQAFIFKDIDFFQIMGGMQIILVLVIYLLKSWGMIDTLIDNFTSFPVLYIINAVLVFFTLSFLFRKYIYSKYNNKSETFNK